ncbi:MAG: transposase [Mycoplasmataceae bacterium RC_NB112A]|nr:MAG: transposase [Mycoplasmataceae bacterium RC_NB112A]KLL02140.1 MAG: transposase [Mycoplasmataceae bacterium RC_NB112A]KLL02169.1 MAG: transposase [Mycoplasmataceae bacterium RC_NB112A]KLL02301.1 MAG: transposase [Mycoplasmataceae bacterium RC_NB112A]
MEEQRYTRASILLVDEYEKAGDKVKNAMGKITDRNFNDKFTDLFYNNTLDLSEMIIFITFNWKFDKNGKRTIPDFVDSRFRFIYIELLTFQQRKDITWQFILNMVFYDFGDPIHDNLSGSQRRECWTNGHVNAQVRNPDTGALETKTITLNADQQKIKYLREAGLSWERIANFCGVSIQSIRKWKKSIIRPKKMMGRKPKISDLQFFHSYVSSHPDLTQQEIADYFSQQLGQSITQQIISRTMKKIDFTYKVIPYRYSEQIPLLPRVLEFIETHKPLLQTSLLLATDESGFPLNLAPRRGYARRGCKVAGHRPAWGNNYSLILLIQNTDKGGVIHWDLVKGAVNKEIFHNFLSNAKLPTDEKYYLLLDNIRFHHSSKVRELLSSKNIEPIYLVSYTPHLNPVELIFNVIKQYARKQKPTTEEKLRVAITKIINILQKHDLRKCFQSCFDYFSLEKTKLNFV